METAKWYVVHTYSGYENKVARSIEQAVENLNMQDYILDVKVPMETVTEVKEGEKKEIERKMYPGYVIVRMKLNDDSWYVVRNIRGVTGFVGADSKLPTPLSDDEILSLGVESHEVVINFKVGDSVRVIQGSLEGFIGVVDSIDKNAGKVSVIVSMMGKDVPAELNIEQVDVLR